MSGWNVLDDNPLACCENHIRSVFAMLAKQPERPIFTGGLEAKILKPWHAEELKRIKAKRMYFAYDTPEDYEPLVEAGKILRNAGHTLANQAARCYVLIGYPGDTFDAAQRRLMQTMQAGFLPYAMLYRNATGQVQDEWKSFQREWCRPVIVATKFRQMHKGLPIM